MGILAWFATMCVVGITGWLICWIIYTVYRVIMYDYAVETMAATVSKKRYKPAHTRLRYDVATKTLMTKTDPAEYKVHILTENGLRDVIDNKDLYEDVEVGSTIHVTLKIGYSRDQEPVIKYFRTTNYSW